MNAFARLETFAASFVWGPAMLLLLTGVGLVFTFVGGFLPFRHCCIILQKTLGSLFTGRKKKGSQGSITPFQAVSTALAGTMGTGNIAGVATAIVAGGPGAVFWMWVSALLGMSTKYAEVLLAVRHRTRNRRGEICGGPMYYLERGAGQRGLAVLFAALCVLASFGIGNMSQVHSAAAALHAAFSIPHWVTGVAAAVLVGCVVVGGMGQIAAFAAHIIPLASLLYLVCAGWVLYQGREALPAAFSLILQSAFDLRAASGGALGYGVLRAMRYGMARGVFSNEAGLGSAPIAHASANTHSGVEQGFWGVMEVFLDTILCCTVTALVILIAGDGQLWQAGLDGSELTTAAFAQGLGGSAAGLVAGSMIFFALSAMLSWYLYGERCMDYLTDESALARGIYRALFLLLAVVGAVASLQRVWAISDLLNGLMALPNLAGLLLLSPEVAAQTLHYFATLRGGKRKVHAPRKGKSGSFTIKW